MTGSVRVDSYFEGIPGAAHGGYIAGLVARRLGPSAEVTLRSLPPLERDLTLENRSDADGLIARDGDVVVLEGRVVSLEVNMPAPVGLAEAEEASRRYAGFRHHNYPRCFMCGPARRDGFRFFPGWIDEREVVAAPWRPERLFLDRSGVVGPELVWAVFDCASWWALGDPGTPMLTGRIACCLLEPIRDEPTVVIGWPKRSEGRRHPAGCAVFSTDGTPLALGVVTWIAVDEGVGRRARV